MATDTLDAFRRSNYEIAEAIAPTWERRREEIERACAPVRDWMVRELRPAEGNTVLELAAGAGDTGFQAAVALGSRGRLITTDFSPADAQRGAPPRRGARGQKRHLRGHGRGATLLLRPTRSTVSSAASATC